VAQDKNEQDTGFHEVTSPGSFDVTDDSTEMLQRVTKETGTELSIKRNKEGRLIAKIVAIAVKPAKKKSI